MSDKWDTFMREHAKSVSSAMDASHDTDRDANEVTYRVLARRTIKFVFGRDWFSTRAADGRQVSRPEQGHAVSTRVPRRASSIQDAKFMSKIV